MYSQLIEWKDGKFQGLQALQPGTASLVTNETLNMCYKNDKNIHFVITRFVFLFKLKCTKICFRPGLRPRPRWESLRRSLRYHSRLGRPLPIPFPYRLDTFGVRASVLSSPPPNTNSWLRHWANAVEVCSFSVTCYWATPGAGCPRHCTTAFGNL